MLAQVAQTILVTVAVLFGMGCILAIPVTIALIRHLRHEPAKRIHVVRS